MSPPFRGRPKNAREAATGCVAISGLLVLAVVAAACVGSSAIQGTSAPAQKTGAAAAATPIPARTTAPTATTIVQNTATPTTAIAPPAATVPAAVPASPFITGLSMQDMKAQFERVRFTCRLGRGARGSSLTCTRGTTVRYDATALGDDETHVTYVQVAIEQGQPVTDDKIAADFFASLSVLTWNGLERERFATWARTNAASERTRQQFGDALATLRKRSARDHVLELTGLGL